MPQDIRHIVELKNQEEKLRKTICDADTQIAGQDEKQRELLATAENIRAENNELREATALTLDQIKKLEVLFAEVATADKHPYARWLDLLVADFGDDDPEIRDLLNAHDPGQCDPLEINDASSNTIIEDCHGSVELPTEHQFGGIADMQKHDIPSSTASERVHNRIIETPTGSKSDMQPTKLTDRFLSVHQDIIIPSTSPTNSISVGNAVIAPSTSSIATSRPKRAAAPTRFLFPTISEQVKLIEQSFIDRLNHARKRTTSNSKH